jgi:acyl transferase domain-containing protein/acyl-CoA synthetase (AMP-forming)/AMP-acid ligase II/NADPH:quinone reductase-like Zn-dependent oxidoreductase/acyl carrier protein
MSLLLNQIHELGELVPQAPAIEFVDDSGSVAESMTRADVVREMSEMAAFLRLRCGLEPGDRALLVYPPGLDFVRALLGCMAAGIVPVPVYPPDPFNAHKSMQGFAKIAADCAANAVLTSGQYAAIKELAAAQSSTSSSVVRWPTGLDWHVTSREATGLVEREMDPARAPADELWVPTPDTPALLQYTSGSTSAPKGVVITFGNLAHQLDFDRRYLGLGLDRRGVFWVPAYHDFGLISAICNALAGNFELILMSPLSFIARPALWFEVMHRVRATHTVSPNFGYELAVRKTTAEQRATWDLSSLTMVMSAAEPVRADTTQRFLEAFAVTGLRPEAFCPSYGLAEHTVGVTLFGRSSVRLDRATLQTDHRVVLADGPGSQVLMGCGKLTDEVDVRVVDPERCVELPARHVGEIWVDSPSKAAGYWAAPEASRATFEARLVGAEANRGYLRTGDLGFVHDGELYICGRVKELLILAGRNIYPQDIEDSLRGCHKAIRPGGIAAFAIDDHDSEALAVLLEVPADTPAAILTQVVAAVRNTVLTQHQLTCKTIAIGPPGTVSKTTSGKLQRARCRTRLADGSLEAEALLVDRLEETEPVDHAPAQALQDGHGPAAGQLDAPITGGHRNGASELLAVVREQAGAVLGIGAAGVDLDQPLGAQGLNSLGVVNLASRLSRVVGREVHSADVFNHPTVGRLAQFLSECDQQSHHQRPPAQGGRYAVIGAGAAGVAAASALIEQGAAEVVVFEAGDRVGGKVYSYTDDQGRVAELGQAAVNSSRRTLGMAARLGLDMIPFAPGLNELGPAGSYQELDTEAEALKVTAWIRQVLAAAGIDGPTTLTELRNRSDLGVGIGTWCRLHGLPAAPATWRHWWTGYGYGPLDDTTPAAYLVAGASLCDGTVAGTPTNLVGQLRVKGGNDQLWTLELQRLQSTGQLHWRPSCPVHALRPSDGAVVVHTQDGQQDRFDQVVVACPPWQARSLLPDGDQRGALLDRFHTTDYITTVFTATGLQLPGGYGVLADTELSMDGRPLQLMVLDSDLFIVWQYGAQRTEAASIDTIAELITALGGQFGHVVRRQHWPFFPRLTPADWEAGVLDALERAQGRDGIVLVGSYLGFETVEHVVTHAQDTVARYCTVPAIEADEPVAIVGMACRAPGGVADPDQFWALLDDARDGVAAFPTRWNTDELYDPDPDAAGKTYAREGGFLDEVESFDAEFFDISPREATAMDPQQRVVLEVAWEALERAGLPIADLDGSDTGVYVGCQPADYELGTLTLEALDGHIITGSTSSVLSGRIAYALGLQGPAITIDTACSSSLVALHLAATALRRHECSLALAGGVQVMSTPATFVEFSRLRALAPDGRCKAFSADADGTGWAEGCGIVVLKRLSDAHRDGDHVLAVMRGSAINQDGRSHGLTAPNGPSQQRVIRRALHRSGLTPADIDVVEAHGTGTTLGDPIEASALAEVFGPTRDPHRPLWLGSVKSNIGHTQAAAGVLGVIKMVLALNHEHLPKTLHAHTPSPHIPWATSGLTLLQDCQPWPTDPQRPRRAGISSFGFSGTNAHLILEQAPAPTPPTPAPSAEPGLPLLRVWPISARTPAALAGQADRLRQYVLAHPDVDLTDVAYSLATTRTAHPYRAAITVPAANEDPRQDLLDALEALHAGHPHPGLAQHHHLGGPNSKIVFVFPGQGSQYPGMTAGLYQRHRVFAAALDQVCAAFDPYLDVPLGEVMLGAAQGDSAQLLSQTAYAQPALFALGVAMSAVFTQWGITADYLLGHSVGELTAAYLAGALSLADAAKLVSARGRLMQACAPGAMLAVQAGEPDVAAMLTDHRDIEIAAVNAATSVVVSGPAEQINAFAHECTARHYQTTALRVSHGFHSAAMDPAAAEFAAIAATVSWQPPHMAVLSNLTGQLATTQQLTSPTYWARHLREPVRFHDGVTTLLADAECVFVELSAHPVLAPAISDTLAVSERTGSVVIPTLHRDHDDLDGLATAVGRLHLHGHSPSWRGVYPQATVVELPTYAFERRRYWRTSTPAADADSLGLDRAKHPLLGAITELADRDEVLMTGRLSLTRQAWLGDHRVYGAVVFPATGFVEIVLHAGEYAGCPVIDELILHTPLQIDEHTPTDLQISVHPGERGKRAVSVHARTGGAAHHDSGWTLHASAVVSTDAVLTSAPAAGVPAVEPLDTDSFYDQLTAQGLGYSGLFRGVCGIGHDQAQPGVVHAEVVLPAGVEVSGYGIHPALLDAALHSLAAALNTDSAQADSAARLPFALSGINLYASAATRLLVRLDPVGADSYRLAATDPAGALVITIDTITLRTLSALPAAEAQPAGPAGLNQDVWELAWSARPRAPRGATAAGAARWAVVTEDPAWRPDGLDGYPVYPGLGHPDLTHTDMVIWALPPICETGMNPMGWVHDLAARVLTGLQTWLARPDTTQIPLVVLTRHAVTTSTYDRAPDIANAAVSALVHTAANEHPGRIRVLDTDDSTETSNELIGVLASLTGPTHELFEPQLALRSGVVYAPRLTHSLALIPPSSPSWQLTSTGNGDLANLALVATESVTALGPGQIRVQIRAAGLNFRDVVVTLGAISDQGLGAEAAGVVIDTAADVSSVRPGDTVMGLFPHNAFAPTAVTDARSVVAVPAGWSLTEAATVPVAFLTAYIALVEIGRLTTGQRVLIHAGAGGVGQAAIQIARHLGAEVFATAHPAKQHVLHDLGIPRDRIASSRTLDFADTFRQAARGQGMDVVLNCLAGDFIDASLQLLGPAGGCFVEIGKTDVRDATDIATTYPGVDYHAYDLSTATPQSLQPAWTVLTELFSTGVLTPLPVTSYGLTQAVQAFRDMSQARHTGKIVLIPPPVLNPEGTVLITGGTGMLGKVIAEHLITRYGMKHLLLVSRRGLAAPGAQKLHERLTGLGARVAITACNTGEPAQLAEVVKSIPVQHPLTAVVNMAGVLDDAVLTELTTRRLDAVLAAKVGSAWHLHQLTTDYPVDAFVLFSSAAGILGSTGQANYNAANAALDALAQQRHRRHLPATSLAWGLWQTPGGMGAQLSSRDQSRLTGGGLAPISIAHGLALFDAALARQHSVLVPAPLNPRTLERLARQQTLPAILSALTRIRPQAATMVSSDALAARLASQTREQQHATWTALVSEATAAVLAHPDPRAITPDRPFKDLGIDSLTALELRNSLSRQAGLTLPTSLTFDHPTPRQVADFLCGALYPLEREQTGLDLHRNNLSSPLPRSSESASEDLLYSLSALFKDAVDTDRLGRGLHLLRAASLLRPTFEPGCSTSILPTPTTFTHGPRSPHLVFICTSVISTGVHNYLRIASKFEGARTVSAVPLCGFSAGEPLPESAEAAVEAVADSVIELVGDEPFVLAGQSSGGNLAYAVAHHFESKQNANLAGVALLDSFRKAGNAALQNSREFFHSHYIRYYDLGLYNATRLTAMAAWFDVMSDLYEGPLETDVLFVQCTKPWHFYPGCEEYVLSTPWSPSHTVRTTQEDHRSILVEGSELAAQILEEWVGARQCRFDLRKLPSQLR